MIVGLQVVAIIFSLIMIYFAYVHYSRGELNGIEILSWIVIWSVTIFITIFPEFLRTFAQTFAISRLFDLMVVGGFILVIALVYKIYVRTKNMERKIEDYIRTEAIQGSKISKRKS